MSKTPKRKAVTDKERLDFIRRFGVGTMGHTVNTVNDVRFYWPGFNCERFCGMTFRQAIDAAIRASRRKP